MSCCPRVLAMNETAETPFGPNSAAVQAHLSILQDVIRRMASNSASCKNWCIVLVAAMLVLVAAMLVLVAAMLVLVARTASPDCALLAVIPTLLFCLLDAYYLALEQAFRSSYNAFVGKLHRDAVEIADLYVVRPTGKINRQLLVSLRSTSIWPFYSALALIIVAVWQFDGIKTLAGW